MHSTNAAHKCNINAENSLCIIHCCHEYGWISNKPNCLWDDKNKPNFLLNLPRKLKQRNLIISAYDLICRTIETVRPWRWSNITGIPWNCEKLQFSANVSYKIKQNSLEVGCYTEHLLLVGGRRVGNPWIASGFKVATCCRTHNLSKNYSRHWSPFVTFQQCFMLCMHTPRQIYPLGHVLTTECT